MIHRKKIKSFKFLNRVQVGVLSLICMVFLVGVFVVHISVMQNSSLNLYLGKLGTQLKMERDHIFNLLLLDQKKNMKDMLETYRKEYKLLSIELVSERCENCKLQNNLLISTEGNEVLIFYPLNSMMGDDLYVKIVPRPDAIFDFRKTLKIYFVIFSVFLFLLVLGIYINASFYKKYLFFPLKNLTNFFTDKKIDDVISNSGVNHLEKLLEERKFECIEQRELEEKIFKILIRLKLAQDKVHQYEMSENVIKIASQVAHDIRSPLAALKVLSDTSLELEEDRRLLLRSAVQRINDIANDLAAAKNRRFVEGCEVLDKEVESYLVSSLIESVVSEKRFQYRGKLKVEIEFCPDGSSYGSFVDVNSTELKRIISNIINNSVESFSEGGRVQIILIKKMEHISLLISDNGKGISRDQLSTIADRGVSYKEGGSGLGLYHAQSTLSNWGGTLKINSKIGKGTTVELMFPKKVEPSWFLPEINIRYSTQIIIVDDDNTIHQIWQNRFKSLGLTQSNIVHCPSPKSLEEWYARQDSFEDVLFLVDYEFLACETNGVQLIRRLNIAKNSILVTSRYEDQKVRDSCEILMIKMLPKNLAWFVPIVKIKNNSFDEVA